MPEEYTLLFNVVTDAISMLEMVRDVLVAAQVQAEEIYISRED